MEINIVQSHSNPDLDSLVKAFYNSSIVYFEVKDNPFDPRIGAKVAFRPRVFGHGSTITMEGMVMEPCVNSNACYGTPGIHWAVVKYNTITKTGTIHIAEVGE